MRLFYLDTVGAAALTKTSLQKDPLFAMCALTVEDSKWRGAHELMVDLKSRYFPEWHWQQVEIKSRFLRMAASNPGDRRLPAPWRPLSASRVAELEGELSIIMQAIDARLSFVAVDKPKLVESYMNPIHPYAIAYAFLKQRAAVYLGALGAGELGMMVADRDTEVERNLAALDRAEGLLERGHTWKAPLERIIEAPFFVDSRWNQIVQLADFAAYDFYAAVRAHPEPYPQFWRHEERLLQVPQAYLITSYLVFPEDIVLQKP